MGTNDIIEEQIKAGPYFAVSPIKFALMNVATVFIYSIYWAYKNWKYIKQRDKSDSWPLVRAIFVPITYYGILSDIREKYSPRMLKSERIVASLAIFYFISNVFWQFPDPYSLLGFLSIVFLLPAVLAIKELNRGGEALAKNSRHRLVNWVVYVIGTPFIVLVVVASLNIIPAASILAGDRLWNKDIVFLQENGLLEYDETIVYIYSSDLFSYQNEGNYFTNKSVVSYMHDPDSGKFIAWRSRYENIEDITTKYSNSWIDPTVITIKTKDNGMFELWVASEGGGDNIFVDQLKKRWLKINN